ncbi:hypothetical protein [Pleurochrysis sp. endemic virus 1a]|nr:hypothetical protein [Pleurochrysis sp. endemic virus 1a]AUL80801.1 hypothetical protein [Pleurochrysis sp. endemic virus 1b]
MRTQAIVSVLMIYATYVTVKCPCDKTLACHLKEYYGSVILAALLVARENDLFRRVLN